ncbi:hypothetical protein S7711_01223 [Stachybotrys chartarum IBT 7711]|uniref:Nineteen complex-related protein 2 domain-containing protein n=1 Tax=Stachybotrys chartarum (strain CBS 109288 / IBT 7711) TaxID=1280523 RepID=A0A084AT20_STACB|nr:hypothetical protein S7711_01223 [Stachybotrys chartarum IBT 7711]KFA48429.1 hypothetical protein S40293_00416 [Stachybotrys chartarum IBT 40293]KFA72951.1 hypothetical protein S40288_05084 [Stachybotrys chartarum IBT 40288]
MSSFGAKRKARIIKVVDDDESISDRPTVAEAETSTQEASLPSFGSKSGKKALKQSGLRRSVNVSGRNDDEPEADAPLDIDDGPVVVRPNVSRSSSLKKKRPQKSTRLSFGGDGGDSGDIDNEASTPKRVPLGQRVLENSALKRGFTNGGLPLRSFQEDDDRPKYSKEYLEELQSSTPNTPQNVSSVPSEMGDEMDLDPSELEGALVVETSDAASPPKPRSSILTDAEIREKKERRARLAKEQDFLSVEDDDDEGGTLNGKKKKEESRLMAEDEDLGEGFDDYVDDGGLSLGKRAEKERRKRDRQQMADMINAAEGHTSDSSSDSDAERRIAYEAAQTRAGMDGLKKPPKNPAQELLQVPPKITPLPSLAECLATLQTSIRAMEVDIKAKSTRVQQLRQEREEITKREGEVQALLDETGRKYQEAMGQGSVEGGTISSNGPSVELVGERGLESLGATPLRSMQNREDV